MKRVKIDPRKNTVSFFFGIKKQSFGSIGANVRICPGGSYYGHSENIYIGDNVFLNREIYMDALSEIYIGAGTMIGPRCTFIGGTHNYNSDDMRSIPYDNVILDRKIVVEENVWIAAGVVVCPGTHIGKGVVVGAGTCVCGNIPEYSVVVSNGYRVIKERDRERYMELEKQSSVYNTMFAGKPFIIRDE